MSGRERGDCNDVVHRDSKASSGGNVDGVSSQDDEEDAGHAMHEEEESDDSTDDEGDLFRATYLEASRRGRGEGLER